MGKKSIKSPSLSAVVFSYVPLLTGIAPDSGNPVDDFKDTLEEIEKLPDGRVDACLWLFKDNKPFPVFVIENMNDIIDHIEWWSEKKPLEWFDLKIRSCDDKYAIALIPRFIRSVERWNLSYQLRVGYPPPSDTNYKIIFRSINFVSGGASTYNNIRDMIGPELQIGFVDTKNVNREDPSQINESDIRILGSFPISQDPSFDDYVESILDDSKNPASS